VRTITFREALWGYLPKEVDRKLVEIADALDAGLSPAAMLANLDFRKALRGYNVKDVDGLLDRLRSS
jgi:DivIVA domain-containing protein